MYFPCIRNVFACIRNVFPVHTQCICAHTQCISRAYAMYFAVHTQCIFRARALYFRAYAMYFAVHTQCIFRARALCFRARALYFCVYSTWPTLHTRAYATCLHCACTARVCNAGGPTKATSLNCRRLVSDRAIFLSLDSQCLFPWFDEAIRCSRSITSREVFWDFRLKDLVWEWFGLLLWTSHLPKYQIQPWSHVKWPGWWLGTAIPIFPWGLNCQQLYPPPLGPPDRLSSRLNIFRL